MSRNAKVLLALAVICFIAGGALNIGLIDARGIAALYTILPIGAVFFGLFLIVRLMDKASEIHPEDQHLSGSSAEGPAKHAPPGGAASGH